MRLRGEFNLENVLAASAAACVLGAEFSSIRRAVREFSGVEHRLEFVREIRGVDFYNDSKATSVDAAAKALSTFERGVHLILGGKDKGAPYSPLRSLMKDRVREVLVIGAAQERIVNDLSGAVEIVEAGDLKTAVRTAAERARPGDVVLLAPACSSFDQFENFEHRGRVFKDLADQLVEEIHRRGGSRSVQPAKEVEPVDNQATKTAPSRPEDYELTEKSEEPTIAASADISSEPLVASEPETLVLTAPRELEYVFEVSAEEASAQGSRGSIDEVDDFVLDEDDLSAAENVHDDAFAYEVRAASDADTLNTKVNKQLRSKKEK